MYRFRRLCRRPARGGRFTTGPRSRPRYVTDLLVGFCALYVVLASPNRAVMADENAYRVKDINTNLRESLPTPREVTLVDQTVFFVTDEVLSGRELWKTDGTGAGTALVLDIWPGVSYSAPFRSHSGG